MSPAILGSFTALGWGSADFIVRFTGRALGHEAARWIGASRRSPCSWWARGGPRPASRCAGGRY